MSDIVSIIIPVYNVPEVVFAIRSCLNQTFQNIEIILVDDGSEEYIEKAIRKITNEKVHYIRHNSNTNANICRNKGIDVAQGKYIAFLDSDDLFMRQHIEECLDCIQKSRTDGIYSSVIIHNGNSPREITAEPLAFNESMANYLLRKGYGACTSGLFMTRESAASVRWDETLNRHQDYDFLVRYSRKFHLTAKRKATVIYNAESGKARPKNIDFNSCIRFSKAHKQEISTNVYRQYITGMLKLAKNLKANLGIIEYYKNELK